MADYVLVHGGWCGSWSYDRTAADLRAAGHRVHVAALAGLGTRREELSPAITLSTHVPVASTECPKFVRGSFEAPDGLGATRARALAP